MKTTGFDWRLSYSDAEGDGFSSPIEATVPGAAGLDVARAEGYPPYYYECNYKYFTWLEDKYLKYETVLDFTLDKGELATLIFHGIDYRYKIIIDGRVLCEGEGMYTPIRLDVSAFSGRRVDLCALVFPIPKAKTARRRGTRDEAEDSVKPPSSYGWDWHPRLVPSGLWGDVTLEIHTSAPTAIDASYVLGTDLSSAKIDAEISTVGSGEASLSLISPLGETVYTEGFGFSDSETVKVSFEIANPSLWYPAGYGEQPIYTLVASAEGRTVSRKIGFRRTKLVRNVNDKDPAELGFPKSRLPAPATLEINGERVFAKGTNWVNTEIFPALMTNGRYEELLLLISDANMNIIRMWGGGFINHEYFYDRCDELGIMIWQEFPLACNLYPDTDEYLSALKQEATTIIKRLRTHPSLALWCGGNELFNSWSGMTDQAHPLRMLNALCYELDRFTPFNMTSPLCGMGHGSYHTLFTIKAAGRDEAGLGGDIACDKTEEFITTVTNSRFTAYTEFGSAGGADPDYIKKYIMSEENYRDFSPKNEVWRAHHAFGAWAPDSWSRAEEIEYYFGGYDNTDDLMRKSLFVQGVSYKSIFEEVRRKWPDSSMAVNWDFNEPWPCAAGNSLVNWPCHPKPAYYAVRDALRPTIASLRTFKNSFAEGETMTAEIWLLNDSGSATEPLSVSVYLEGDKRRLLATESFSPCAPRSNAKGSSFTLEVDGTLEKIFTVSVEVEGYPEYNSRYEFIKR